ncbi:MAG: DUF4870 domain-containing protein [Candidatus Saccharibacteria bacterium]
MNPELSNYVANARKSGLSDADIRQKLTASGWQAADIESAFSQPQAPAVPAVPPAAADASNQMVMAILAYLGILILIPLLVAKDNQFVKFHIKQGLVLVIIWVAYWFLTAVFGAIHLWVLNMFVYPIVGLGTLILAIIGIINAVNGQQKELPVVGSLARKFTF